MIDMFHLSNITHRLFSSSCVPREHADVSLSGVLWDKGVTLVMRLCRPDKVISISLTKAVVIAFEEQHLPSWLMVSDFCRGRRADRGGAPQLDVTGEMSLSYLSGRAAKPGFVTSRDGERKTRGEERDETRQRVKEKGGTGKIKSEGCWREIQEEIKEGWKGWVRRVARGFEYRHKWKSRREEERSGDEEASEDERGGWKSN